MGNKDREQITIIWKNIDGEAIYTETLPAIRVLSLIQTDDRAFYNTFVLGDKTKRRVRHRPI
ncbi:MAG: hypothetical protein AAFR22_26055 [Chloroflexota bacterium]